MKEKVYEALENMDINYEVVNHPPALTIEQADLFIEGKEGVRTKTMFLTNKNKNTCYLLILDESKRLDLKKIGQMINAKGLKFGSEDKLYEKMQLQFGVVSLFGLLNNIEKDINIYIDSEIMGQKSITFHPNENTATVFISITDMLKFLDILDFNYEIIDM